VYSVSLGGLVTIRSLAATLTTMGKIDDIKNSLEALSVAEQQELMDWFVELRERLFDEAIERDAKAGKLDALVRKAIQDDEAGRTRPL
jgi:predicted  nucleic acid-binding Zn-ribbon protein